MRYWTWGEIKNKVESDLDLKGEDFVTPDELLGYANEAIDAAEAEIHNIYEDYFLTSADVSIVAGNSKYSMPDDIYANKIRAFVYNNGSLIYSIKRLRSSHKFENIALIDAMGSSSRCYNYIITNSSTDGIKIELVPPPNETGSYGKLWYLRNALRLTGNDSDLCDIPEFVSFVIQYMKVRIMEKENHPNLPVATAALQSIREQMVNTLSDMVDDGDTSIELDMSAYEEAT